MSATALLMMDVQTAVVEQIHEPDRTDALAAMTHATVAARAAGIAVIYVRVGFRPGTPDVSRRNRSLAAVYGSTDSDLTSPGREIHPAVTPQIGDIEVVKKRVSAFVGSDLEVVLRSLDVSALILSGLFTSGVVLSTLRQAADLDYQLTVLWDACADPDGEAHSVLLERIFPKQAAVISTVEWIRGLSTVV